MARFIAMLVAAAALLSAAAAEFVQTGALQTGRKYHTATLLLDGRVLVVGGYNAAGTCLNTAELYDPATGRWNSTDNNLSVARCHHAATLLQDFSGEVFVTGGVTNGGTYLASTEVFDPATNTWSTNARDNMRTARAFHAALSLERDDVLVVGGYNGAYLTSVEQFRVDTPLTPWNPVGDLKTARANHTATLVGDTGRVLVAGGTTNGGAPVATGEFCTNFYYCTWAFTINDMSSPRTLHTANYLGSSDILISGGLSGANTASDSTELYDNAFFYEIIDSNYVARYEHESVLLQDKTVILIGGFNPANGRYVPHAQLIPRPLRTHADRARGLCARSIDPSAGTSTRSSFTTLSCAAGPSAARSRPSSLSARASPPPSSRTARSSSPAATTLRRRRTAAASSTSIARSRCAAHEADAANAVGLGPAACGCTSHFLRPDPFFWARPDPFVVRPAATSRTMSRTCVRFGALPSLVVCKYVALVVSARSRPPDPFFFGVRI